MLQIPLEFVKRCDNRVLLHLAVTLQNVQMEALKKQMLAQQNVVDGGKKVDSQTARAGGRGVQDNHELAQLAFLGILQRLNQRHRVVVRHAVGIPGVGKIRVVDVPVFTYHGKRAQKRCKPRVVFRQRLQPQPLRAGTGADFRPVRAHIGLQLSCLALPEGGKITAIFAAG